MDLPEGLGEVDFLDGSDKTTIGSIPTAEAPGATSTNDPFDQWCDPQNNADPSQSLWAETPQSFSETPLDPLASFTEGGDNASPFTDNTSDPLSALTESSGTSSSPWDNQPDNADNWWLSEPDDAPAIEQAMVIPKPETDRIPPHRSNEPTLNDMSLEQLLQPSPEQNHSEQSRQTINPPADPAQTRAASHPSPEHNKQPPAGTVNSGLAEKLGLSELDHHSIQNLESESAELIKETVCRLMDLLRARSCIKNELRVERTMIESQDNNPLKFSATAEDAIGMMFGAGHSAFLPASESVREGFDNISDHQVAVLVAMRAAYEHMITGFSPETLETLFERSGQQGRMFGKNAKNWQAYKDWYQEMLKDQENTYNRLFGEVFATTYEKKLAELDSARKL